MAALLNHRRTRSDEHAISSLTHRRTRSDEQYLSDDDEDDLELDSPAPELHGTLSKWTNYIHGWQDRYIVLKNGTLSYYKSEHDTNVGCRGAITIHRATIKPHEFDENRFDVSVSDCIWYLRAETPEEKQRWVDTLELHKVESGYGSETSLRRHGSTLSLQSATLSSSSFKKGRGLREKLAELETFRDILCRQIDTLQNYFDACAESVAVLNRHTDDERGYGGDLEEGMEDLTLLKESFTGESKSHTHPLENSLSKELILQHGAHAVDFKGEAITFKATTAGILATLSHCIEVMSQREDQLRKKLEKETERRKRLDDLYKQTLQEAQDAQKKAMMIGGPDYEEGPNSVIGEEEFFDAVESGLDKIEEEEDDLRLGTERSKNQVIAPISSHEISIPKTSPLWPEINRITTDQQEYALAGVEEGTWTLFAEEGEMKLYKREEEVDGMVCDPLKAVHTIKGVTGHEMASYFFNPDYRMDWEITLESFKTLETVSDDTMIFHQIHKRVWPATQRDSLFWSHIRRSPNPKDEDQNDIWIVCNHSTNHPSVTPSSKMLRVILTVCLVCQTFIDPPKVGQEITRDNLTCKVTYCSVVNPGGWAPAPVLRAVYKREYPRFLKRFTQYVKNQCSNTPIIF